MQPIRSLLVCFTFIMNCFVIPILCIDSALVQLIDPAYNIKNITVLERLSGGMRGYVTAIKDNNGQKFVVKQYKVHDLDMEFGVVRETLAAYVGETVGIPLNRVVIIPAEREFPGKIFPLRPATLHTYAPGTRVDHHKVYAQLSLRQRYKTELPFEKRGLTLKIINSMALHPDLPVIVAFDTFVSNSSRLNKNFFYDDATDRFCGIDLEQAFRKPFDHDFAEISSQNVKTMINDKGLKFIHKELKGIEIYTQTLKKLITLNPPEKILAMLDDLLSESGLSPELYKKKHPDVDIVGYVSQCKKRIKQQYIHAQELAASLDKLLQAKKVG